MENYLEINIFFIMVSSFIITLQMYHRNCRQYYFHFAFKKCIFNARVVWDLIFEEPLVEKYYFSIYLMHLCFATIKYASR